MFDTFNGIYHDFFYSLDLKLRLDWDIDLSFIFAIYIWNIIATDKIRFKWYDRKKNSPNWCHLFRSEYFVIIAIICKYICRWSNTLKVIKIIFEATKKQNIYNLNIGCGEQWIYNEKHFISTGKQKNLTLKWAKKPIISCVQWPKSFEYIEKRDKLYRNENIIVNVGFWAPDDFTQ